MHHFHVHNQNGGVAEWFPYVKILNPASHLVLFSLAPSLIEFNPGRFKTHLFLFSVFNNFTVHTYHDQFEKKHRTLARSGMMVEHAHIMVDRGL